MRTFTYAWAIIAVLFTLPTAYAQDAKSTLSNEWIVPLENAKINNHIAKKAEPFQDKKYYSNMQLIQLRSISDVQKDGILSFHVPSDKNRYEAIAQDIEAENKFNYNWFGEILNLPGSMTVVSTKGQINAHISIDDQEYEIHPLGDGVHAIVKLAPQDFDNIVTCPDVPIAENRAPVEEDPTNGREVGCNVTDVRVLVLSTARARATGLNILGTANTAIADFNQIQRNSAVNGRLRLTLAGIANLNFTETFRNIERDVALLAGNGDAIRLRDQFDADLVVLLADQDYAGIRGIVDAIGPSFNDAFAIVRVRDAVSEYTFSHEIGHLYGAQHEDCGVWNPGACIPATPNTFDHGFNFVRDGSLFRRTRRYHTLMHRLRNDYNRVPNFSNPDVTYDTRATGIPNAYDNAREIEIWDRTVSNFDRDETLTVSIDGPTTINLYTGYTWEAVYNCGSNYTFQWETSDDGFNYYAAGTGETMSRSVYNSSTNNIYIRVRVSSGGQTTTSFRTVYVNGSGLRRGIAQGDSTSWGDLVETIVENPEDKGILLDYVYPNPANNQSKIGFYLPAHHIISLDVIDLNGKVLKNVVDGNFEAGSYELNVDHSELSSGVYLYRLDAGETKLTKRLVINKR